MSENNYQVYDFASGARVERPVVKGFGKWMQKFAESFSEHWKNFSDTSVDPSPIQVDAHEFGTLQAKWDRTSYALEIRFSDASSRETSGMIVCDRLEILTLLMDVLRDTDEPTERELTSVEDSLCEMILEQTGHSLVHSWPQQQEISVKIGELTQGPNGSRMFAADKNLLTSGLNLQVGGAAVKIQVVLAKDETIKLLGIDPKKDTQPKNDARLSTAKIAEIDVEVTVGLGCTELAMDDLVSISVGDVIILEQSVEEPVLMYANSEPVFRAWPGRLALQQALMIASELN
ncbi:MAG: FliM/FliN family flagellar motor switch protein [Mariniblastus sp.]